MPDSRGHRCGIRIGEGLQEPLQPDMYEGGVHVGPVDVEAASCAEAGAPAHLTRRQHQVGAPLIASYYGGRLGDGVARRACGRPPTRPATMLASMTH